MRLFGLTLSAGALLVWSIAAHAQTIGIGTTSGGANAQVGAAISGVVSSHTDLEMRPQKMGGTQGYVPMVDAGRLEFGVSNAMQYYMAKTGSGLSEDQPHENLMLAATLMKFTQGVIVRADSDIRSIADLEGKRVPTGYSGSPLFQTFWDAFLSAEDLTWDDVQGVPVASLPKSWDAFKQGQVDAVIAAAGSAPVREMDASVDGGIRYIPLPDSDAMMDQMPRTRLVEVEPAEELIGIEATMQMHVYEYVLFTHADAPDEVVYETVKALYENEEELKDSSPLWNSYAPGDIGTDFDLDYHPAAMRFFEEEGLFDE